MKKLSTNNKKLISFIVLIATLLWGLCLFRVKSLGVKKIFPLPDFAYVALACSLVLICCGWNIIISVSKNGNNKEYVQFIKILLTISVSSCILSVLGLMSDV